MWIYAEDLCLLFCLLQEEIMKKKYGGLLPKKPPLISKVNTCSSKSSLSLSPEIFVDHITK